MKRKITEKLKEWKNKKNRKPLLLNGARQIGKSYSLDAFGEECYENVVHVMLDVNEMVRKFFNTDIDPKHIIQFLESSYSQKIVPDRTLIILDEIQASKRALQALKSFCEQAPEYNIVAAGSLLGVAISRNEEERNIEYSFPVGKVNELNMYPMDFEEFLWAMGKEILAEEIREHYKTDEKMPSAMHEEALDYYRQYLVTGGMPEAVKTYVDSHSFIDVAEVQAAIISDYIDDMSKYALPSTSVKIRGCYNSIPVQLAKENKKFQYKIVKTGGTSSYFGESIDWLEQGGVVMKCNKISHGYIPIEAYRDISDFKIYMSDIGLLTQKANMPPSVLLQGDVENTYMGGIVENYVAQALASNKHPLYYWKNDNTAEEDFVLQEGDMVVPIEVKKGVRVRSKSMKIFMEEYKCKKAIRISSKNFGVAENIKSVPLYAVFCI